MHSKTQGRQWSVRCIKRGIDYHLFEGCNGPQQVGAETNVREGGV